MIFSILQFLFRLELDSLELVGLELVSLELVSLELVGRQSRVQVGKYYSLKVPKSACE